MFRVIVTPILLLMIGGVVFGQQSTASPKPYTCGEVLAGYGTPQKAPVIYGEPYTVPKFRLQITDKLTGVPIVEREVIVRYVWRWFEYPYQEHPRGVWSEAHQSIRCMTDTNGDLKLPEFKVVPSGWYTGKMLKGHKPEFTHLEVSVHLEKHISSVRITKDELALHNKRKADVIELKVPLNSPLSP